MAFKLALSAGHGLYTAGKRCLKSIDPNETREWWLNNRIADRIEVLLKFYSDIEVLRLDDTTGATDVALSTRSSKANNWKADFYLAVHTNAGVNGGAGGGITAYAYNGSIPQSTLDWQEDLYNELIKLTGLKGDRSNGCPRANLHECREPNMDAVLLELGFMDSATDVPIILTDKFADQCAQACVNVIVKRAKLGSNQTQSTTTTATSNVNITYQTWDDVKNAWLPNVVGNSDYAGIFGHDICAVYANLAEGDCVYKIHTQGGTWLPEVKNRTDYAGIFNKPIDGFMIKSTNSDITIYYQVHIRGGNWLPYVTGYNIQDANNGYAGIFGKSIDGIRMYAKKTVTTVIPAPQPAPTPTPTPEPVVQKYYRVRTSWADSKSQKGAYTSLESAKECCQNAGEGYKVFDWDGKEVYTYVAPKIEPTPQPTPVEPTPVKPTPVEPTPEPTPVEPEPENNDNNKEEVLVEPEKPREEININPQPEDIEEDDVQPEPSPEIIPNEDEDEDIKNNVEPEEPVKPQPEDEDIKEDNDLELPEINKNWLTKLIKMIIEILMDLFNSKK